MTTRLTNRLLPFATAVLLSHQAAALEEVVVYGTDLSLKTEEVTERVAAAMSDYIVAANDAQKDALEAEMSRMCERQIQLAAATLPTRG